MLVAVIHSHCKRQNFPPGTHQCLGLICACSCLPGTFYHPAGSLLEPHWKHYQTAHPRDTLWFSRQIYVEIPLLSPGTAQRLRRNGLIDSVVVIAHDNCAQFQVANLGSNIPAQGRLRLGHSRDSSSCRMNFFVMASEV
jgi:hypothetical protein